MNPQTSSLENKTNFYFSFLLLPGDQRRALETLYRFCWAADEISDSTASLSIKRKKLKDFRKNLESCVKGTPTDPFFKKFQSVFNRFELSKEPLERILKGVERDLSPVRFKTFQQLHSYALQVAGGPGLAIMEIFGFKDMPHRRYAENLGIFLQLVNITRDFKEDMELNRQYFPTEDFKRLRLNPLNITSGDPKWKAFVEFQLGRAWTFLKKSRSALNLRQRRRLQTAETIAGVYLRLFEKLKRSPGLILEEKIALSKVEKLWAVVATLFRLKWGRG